MNVKAREGFATGLSRVPGTDQEPGWENGQFPGPWSVESTEGGHLVVRDADGTALAYVFVQLFGSINRNGLSSRHALMIAESIARIGDHA